jgi:hypothetical protein
MDYTLDLTFEFSDKEEMFPRFTPDATSKKQLNNYADFAMLNRVSSEFQIYRIPFEIDFTSYNLFSSHAKKVSI